MKMTGGIFIPKSDQMKMLLIVALLLNIACVGQQAPKGTNTIKVKGVSFRQVANALLDAGYSFKSIDSNYNILTTEPKSYSRKADGMVQLNIRVKDSVVMITGYCGLYESDLSNNPGRGIVEGKTVIANRGMKGSLLKDSFGVMDNFAKSLKGVIVYAKSE